MDVENYRRLRDIRRVIGPPPPVDQKRRAIADAKRLLRPLVDQIISGSHGDCVMRLPDVVGTAKGAVRPLLIDLLVDRLKSKDPRKHANATLALAAFGWQAIAAVLIRLRRTRSVDTGLRSAEALGALGSALSLRNRMELILRLDAIAADNRKHAEIRRACRLAILAIRRVNATQLEQSACFQSHRCLSDDVRSPQTTTGACEAPSPHANLAQEASPLIFNQ